MNDSANKSKFHQVLNVLGEGLQERLHLGAQLYISRAAECLANFSVGEAGPGVPMTPGILMLWLSSGKPLTAVAIAQQVERARLNLEDKVTRFVPEFAQNGKGGITLK